MSCGFPRETLALYVEGDLPPRDSDTATAHVRACAECTQFLTELRKTQAAVKLARVNVTRADCAVMRREVMAAIADGRDRSGWLLRLERMIVLAFRPRVYAAAATVLVAAVSVSVFTQIRSSATSASESAARSASTTLQRPSAYREWVVVTPGAVADATGSRSYMEPASYREFAATGSIPEGAVMVWEPAAPGSAAARGPHAGSATLLASVKDSRFDGGWGFFDFTAANGVLAARARALPESTGCRNCHRQGAGFLASRG